MALRSLSQLPARGARSLFSTKDHAAARLRLAACVAFALGALACGSSDPVEEGDGVGAAAAGDAGGIPGGGQGGAGAGMGGSNPGAQADGSVSTGSDASIQSSLDGGMPIPVEPPKPLADASIMGPPLGNAYAETEYNLERPEALVLAYGVLTAGVGSGTQLFVNHLHVRDGGATVAYGAADVLDGGLAWQKPPAEPNAFSVGVSSEGERMFVSNPFKYILEARVPNPLSASSVFRVYLESEQTVWSASFSPDYEAITTGALYGVVTRAHAESRPLSIGSLECLAVCTDLGACGAGISTLAGLLDCNGAQLDADADGDGTNDGYRLIVSFKSRRVAPPVN